MNRQKQFREFFRFREDIRKKRVSGSEAGCSRHLILLIIVDKHDKYCPVRPGSAWQLAIATLSFCSLWLTSMISIVPVRPGSARQQL